MTLARRRQTDGQQLRLMPPVLWREHNTQPTRKVFRFDAVVVVVDRIKATEICQSLRAVDCSADCRRFTDDYSFTADIIS